jgi:hypothetical protein
MKRKLLLKLSVSLMIALISQIGKTQPPRFKDTSRQILVVNWDYVSPRQLEIKKSGQEKEMLPTSLLESRILPNDASRQLIHALNKNMPGDLPSGSTLKLPVFPVIMEVQKKQFATQYNNDLTVDERQNAVFSDRIDYFRKLLAHIKNINGSKELNDQLSDVKRIFSIVQKMGASLKFMVFQVKVLNEEIDDFNDSLLSILSRQRMEKRDIENGKFFNEDICNLINPILGNSGIKRMPIKLNTDYFYYNAKKIQRGPFVNAGDLDSDGDDDRVTDAVEPAIPVCFYVFESDGSPSTIPYWVYCVPQRAYNQFSRNERSLQSLDQYRALGKASTAYKTLETSFPRYFFAVSDSGVMSEVQLFEVYAIPKDVHSQGMTQPYSFPIYLKK